MYIINPRIEIRIYVKIRFSEKNISALSEVVYYRNEMTVEFFQKWKWYFEYRSALLRVKYPHGFIDYTHGSYEYILPEDKYRTKVKNQYLSDKRQLSKFNNKLKNIRDNWNELFPLEQNPHWKKIEEKRTYYEIQFETSKKEYEEIFK